jgi:5'-3' exoribonuclease 1
MSASRLLPHVHNPNDFHDIVIETSIAYIDIILAVAMPKTLLYIAVDGACPRAKLQQQRKRRYMSVWRNNQIGNVNSMWDSNVVTPGTEFMNKFNEKLANHVQNVKTSTPFDIILSDSSEFGEGEHKIFDYITSNKSTGVDLDIVYGLDADLIMLSLLQEANIHLLRETPEFNMSIKLPFLELDVSLLKEILCKECLESDPNRVRDYVFLCTLLGNDFIPPLSFLSIKNDGVDLLLRVYKKCIEEQDKTTYLTYPKELNWNLFTRIIKELANIENACFSDAEQIYYNKRAFKDNRGIESFIDSYPIMNKHPRNINVCLPQWRNTYYKELFHVYGDALKTSCEKYIEGINWIFEYYNTKQHNLGWYYPFHYSPTCMDLYNHLIANETISAAREKSKNNHDSHAFYKKTISKPYMQLLMVLPPNSKDVIPKRFQVIMSDISRGCVQFYPNNFTIDTYLKTYLWECSACLPDMDIATVYKAYQTLC